MMSTSTNPLVTVDITETDVETAKKLLNAAQHQGFLFIDGHDFMQDEVDELFRLSKSFFEMPLNDKRMHPIDQDDCGYTDYGQELLDPSMGKGEGDPKEAFNFGRFDFLTGECHNSSLPQLFVDNEELLKTITKKFYNVSLKVLKLLAIGLEIEESEGGADWFGQRHKPDTKQITAMRLLHYPATRSLSPETTIRAGAHTDYGSITLLLQQQNEEGLELFSELKGKWESVPYIASLNKEYLEAGKAAPIIVNIADQLSFWTGGLLKSTKHRVVLPQDSKDRYSIVFFLNADDDVLLEPIPSALVANKVGILNRDGKVMTSREHLSNRFEATYIDGH